MQILYFPVIHVNLIGFFRNLSAFNITKRVDFLLYIMQL